MAVSFSVQAQTVLLHVDNTANMYVSNGTLVYNGGGLQTKGSGKIELHGNMMVQGNGSSDVLKTITNDPTPIDKVNGGNIVIKINNPASPVTSTYGQLFIRGFAQSAITGIVDKEYAATKHGAYQQIGIPFIGKTFASLSTDLGNGTNVFNATRWGGREILKWSNAFMRFDGSTIPSSPIPNANVPGIAIDFVNNPSLATTLADRTAYFTVGTGGTSTTGYNPELLRTVRGVPYADGISGTGNTISLIPSNVVYGPTGDNRNIYQEKYNTYIRDPFDPIPAWTAATFGKYYYQFSNPYLTNLDLSFIGYVEPGAVTDNNNISNIWGIVVDPQNVTWNSSTGGNAAYAETQKVTFDVNGRALGNLPSLIIKPLNTFKIKLRNNISQTLDFDNLRRFAYTPRIEGAGNPYSVTAAKNNSGTIKQLGILALDSSGNQIGETFYVVAPHYTTGHINNPSLGSVQALTSSTGAIIQTFEESVNGGVDSNYSSTYRLYINEANESNYLGKRIDLSVFGQNVTSLKFEVREDMALIPSGTHALSTGTGFYYITGSNGNPVQIHQGDIIPVNNSNYGLYYGTPQTNGSLNTIDLNTKSRTLITYNPIIDQHIVRFDSDWKTASVEVFDVSGKLIISEKSVKTDSDYVIKLDSSIKAMYIVKVIGNDGTIVNGKILTK
ncbi:T9SS type A sorting domain-containing protein [Chryseobacterium taihuense]|uniref:T9SS type A sorting domain-containing protein n=1 Tax=Chryseobacterium taihuense TaxID=1141221 RepID=UPI0015A4B72A|nr:T9SS type A sorting domain-containing protein [Chryseobacterium taihuense]